VTYRELTPCLLINQMECRWTRRAANSYCASLSRRNRRTGAQLLFGERHNALERHYEKLLIDHTFNAITSTFE